MTTFLSLATSSSMFPLRGRINMVPLTPEMVKGALIGINVVSAVNKSHTTTLDVIKRKFGIDLPVPDKAPKVFLQPGDSLIIVQANLPRLNEGEVHSSATVESAEITFRLWEVEGL
jgi:hypothetical protein